MLSPSGKGMEVLDLGVLCYSNRDESRVCLFFNSSLPKSKKFIS